MIYAVRQVEGYRQSWMIRPVNSTEPQCSLDINGLIFRDQGTGASADLSEYATNSIRLTCLYVFVQNCNRPATGVGARYGILVSYIQVDSPFSSASFFSRSDVCWSNVLRTFSHNL
jgi:hypothetical protein